MRLSVLQSAAFGLTDLARGWSISLTGSSQTVRLPSPVLAAARRIGEYPNHHLPAPFATNLAILGAGAGVLYEQGEPPFTPAVSDVSSIQANRATSMPASRFIWMVHRFAASCILGSSIISLTECISMHSLPIA